MIKLIPVENHESLFRDNKTKAIVNTNRNELEAYKKKKKLFSDVENLKNKEAEVTLNMNSIKNISQTNEQLKEDINNLKNEIQSLKELVLMSLENKG